MHALIVSIVVGGALYSLEAIGFVLIFRGTGVLNFAQGQLMALGAYIAYDLISRFGDGHFWTSTVVMMGFVALVGGLIYRLVLTHFEGAPVWGAVMALFGISSILDASIRLNWSAQLLYLPPPIVRKPIHFPGGFVTSELDLILTLAAAVLILLVLGVVYLTPLGLQMRATSENKALAAYRGVRVERITITSWLIASAVIAFAGLSIGLTNGISPDISSNFLSAFPAVVLGGLESIGGAIAASFILVAILQAGTTYISPDVSLPLSYAVLLLVLLLRPYGLAGARDIVRV